MFRFTLNATPAQEALLLRYADAYRSTYNFGWSIKNERQQRWNEGRDLLMAQGMSKEEATRKAPKVANPKPFTLAKIFRLVRDMPLLTHDGEERRMYPWWEGVNENMCCQAFHDVQRAWDNWYAGRAKYPKLKRRGKSRPAFRVQSINSLPDPRHVTVPGIRGQKGPAIRLHGTASTMLRLVKKHAGIKGCGIKGVTFSKDGPRWFASFNVSIPEVPGPQPDQHQRAHGAVGVDLGVKNVAALSKQAAIKGVPSRMLVNPRHMDQVQRQLRKWERRKARRYVKGKPAREQSAGWHEACRRVAKLHWKVKCARRDMQNHLTKALATQFGHVVIEDLRVKGMTKSARGTLESPGRNVAAKSGLNREILRVGWHEIRRQLEYKAPIYGSRVTVVNPAYTSRTCAVCGHEDAGSRRTQAQFRCTACGHADHADTNAAVNIQRIGEGAPQA